MDNGFVHIDQDDFPLVKVVFKPGQPTERQLKEYLGWLLDLYLEDKSIVFLFDFRCASYPSRYVRKKHKEWFHKNKPLLTSKTLGVSFVMHSVWIRLLLWLVYSFRKHAFPLKFTHDLEEAHGWAISILHSSTENDEVAF